MGRRFILMQYFKWLRDEIKSINTAGSVMLAFMLGVQLAFLLTGELNTMALVTFAATMVGSACTVYMVVGKPINGLLGLISAIGFIYIDWSAGHYASVLDQLVFVVLIDLPLLIKWRTWGHRVEGGVKFLSRRGWLLTIVGTAVCCFAFKFFKVYLRLLRQFQSLCVICFCFLISKINSVTFCLFKFSFCNFHCICSVNT